MLQAKAYWSILKTFYNDKKIPLIPQVFVDNKFVTNIKTKANTSNEYFAEQYTFLKSIVVLPVNQTFSTQSRLTSLDFNEEEILKIIRALNIHKTHGCDNISITILKICDKSLLKPLIFYFKAQLSYLITQIYGKGLILYPCIKRMINN